MGFDQLEAARLTSSARGTELLVLLSIAQHEDHARGGNSFPSVETIAREANTSRRTVLYCLESLKRSGQLVITGKKGKSIIYRTTPNGRTGTVQGGVTSDKDAQTLVQQVAPIGESENTGLVQDSVNISAKERIGLVQNPVNISATDCTRTNPGTNPGTNPNPSRASLASQDDCVALSRLAPLTLRGPTDQPGNASQPQIPDSDEKTPDPENEQEPETQTMTPPPATATTAEPPQEIIDYEVDHPTAGTEWRAHYAECIDAGMTPQRAHTQATAKVLGRNPRYQADISSPSSAIQAPTNTGATTKKSPTYAPA